MIALTKRRGIFKMPFYFAYGSCMSLKDIQRTEPFAELVGVGRVYNKRLAFTRYSANRKGGVADIVDSSNPYDFVEGYVFHVPNFRALDAREGHPHIYKRKPILISMGMKAESNNLISCDTYEVVNKFEPEYKPSKLYVGLIMDGAKGLSDEYQEVLDFVINHIPRKQYRTPKKRTYTPVEDYSDFTEYDEWEELKKRMGGVLE
jgi:cation transport regulator ChaC